MDRLRLLSGLWMLPRTRLLLNCLPIAVLILYSYSGEDWQMYTGNALYSYGALLGLPQPQLLFRL